MVIRMIAEVFTLFLSTPSARRATRENVLFARAVNISIHALRVGGDTFEKLRVKTCFSFLPTPSARWATETGAMSVTPINDFYPRPPRGGRRLQRHKQTP